MTGGNIVIKQAHARPDGRCEMRRFRVDYIFTLFCAVLKC